METKFQTSFIPKTTIQTSVGQIQRRTPYSLFVLFSFIVFLASLLLAVGSFFYVKFLESSKVSLEEDLNKNIESIERRTIEGYARLDTRIETASILLKNHIALTNFLDFLSQKTLKTVKFNNLKYKLSDDQKYATITMTGVASSYNSVAHQANVFSTNKDLVAPIFSDLDLDEDGNVTFSFSARINSSFIYYGNNVNTAISATPANSVQRSSQSSGATSGTSQNTELGSVPDIDAGSESDLSDLDQILP